jgi:hypothetical protein
LRNEFKFPIDPFTVPSLPSTLTFSPFNLIFVLLADLIGDSAPGASRIKFVHGEGSSFDNSIFLVGISSVFLLGSRSEIHVIVKRKIVDS